MGQGAWKNRGEGLQVQEEETEAGVGGSTPFILCGRMSWGGTVSGMWVRPVPFQLQR